MYSKDVAGFIARIQSDPTLLQRAKELSPLSSAEFASAIAGLAAGQGVNLSAIDVEAVLATGRKDAPAIRGVRRRGPIT